MGAAYRARIENDDKTLNMVDIALAKDVSTQFI
jgi:hypothetical protein